MEPKFEMDYIVYNNGNIQELWDALRESFGVSKGPTSQYIPLQNPTKTYDTDGRLESLAASALIGDEEGSHIILGYDIKRTTNGDLGQKMKYPNGEPIVKSVVAGPAVMDSFYEERIEEYAKSHHCRAIKVSDDWLVMRILND